MKQLDEQPPEQATPMDADKLEQIMAMFPNDVSLAYGRTDGGSDDDPDQIPERVVAVFQFSEKGFGFGEITIVQTPQVCFIDTEHMSRETVKRFLSKLVDSAIVGTESDPVKHRLYSQERGRRCGAGCKICFPAEGNG